MGPSLRPDVCHVSAYPAAEPVVRVALSAVPMDASNRVLAAHSVIASPQRLRIAAAAGASILSQIQTIVEPAATVAPRFAA